MRELAGIVGTFAPLLLVAIAGLGLLRSKALWAFSVTIHSISWICFLLVMTAFYSSAPPEGGFVTAASLGSLDVGGVTLRWDFLSCLLALASSSIILTLHFLSASVFHGSRATVAAIGGYQLALLGGLAAGNVFLFSVFLAVSLLPRLILIGLDKSEHRLEMGREAAILTIFSFLLLMICVLVFEPARAGVADWFKMEGHENIVKPGALGFAILFLSAMLSAGLFPFHGSLRKVYQLRSLEASVLLSFQPIFGFILLFRFASQLFASELHEFGPALLLFFALVLVHGAIGFLGSKSARTRVFWIQQSFCAFVIVGLLGLTTRGWHGAMTLLFFESITIPFLLMVLICHEQEGKSFSVSRMFHSRILAVCTVVAVLSALGSPISIGFYGLLLVVWSLMSVSYPALGLCLFSLLLFLLAGVRIMFFQLGQPEGGGNAGAIENRRALPILPLAIFLCCLGLAPHFVMGPLGSTMAVIVKGLLK